MVHPSQHSEGELTAAELEAGRLLFAGSCDFIAAANNMHVLPPEGLPEICFAGRSNVGKSSLINALTGRKALARTSNTPGRTQLINVFSHVDGGTVVDLPGYGYAKVPQRIRRDWPEMIEGYLLDRETLVMVFVLVDGAIGPTPLDAQMLDWLRENEIPHTVVATKSDKVKSSKRPARKRDLAEGCQLDPGDVVWVSSTKGDGIERLRDLVRLHLAG